MSNGKTSWVQECPRRMMVGFHVPDYDQVPDYGELQKQHQIGDILEHVDPKTFVKEIKRADAQCFWFYAKCHYGNAYYPSKVGHVHSAIGDRDLFGEFTEACLSHDIVPLCCYEFSDMRMPKDHPEWCHRIPVPDDKGARDLTDADQGSRVSGPCLNGPYGDFVIEQTVEVLKEYPVKGYLIDFLGLFGLEQWICPFCAPKFKAEFDFDFEGVDKLTHDQYVAYVKWHYAENDRYAKKIRKVIKDVRPDVVFTHNFHGQSDGVNMQRTEFALENCDYLHNDLFHLRAGMLQMSWKPRINGTYSRVRPAEILLDSIGCLSSDFSTTKALDTYKAEMWTVRSENCACCSSIIMNIDGHFDRHVMALNKQVYRDQKAFEPWLSDMEPIALVGLVRSHNTLEFRPREDFFDTALKHHHHALEFEGWVQTLVAAHQLWTVVPEHLLTDDTLSRLKVLILPEVSCMSRSALAAVRAFVKRGGTLIATGDTSLFDEDGHRHKDFRLGSVFGARLAGPRDFAHRYTRLKPPFVHKSQPWMSEMLCYQDGQLSVKPRRDARVLGDVFDKTSSALVNAYVPTNLPGFLGNKPGKGKCFYLAGTPGAHYRVFGADNIRALLTDLVERGVGRQAPVAVDGPGTVEVFAHRQARRSCLVVNLVNTVSSVSRAGGQAQTGSRSASPMRFDQVETMPRVADVTLRFRSRGRRSVKRVYLAPDRRRLSCRKQGRDTIVNLKSMGVHAMVVADLEAQQR